MLLERSTSNRHQPRPHAVFHTRVALKQQTPTQTTCCIPHTCGPQTTDTNPDHMLYSTHVWPSNNRHQPRPHAVFHTRVALKQQTPTQTTCCIPHTCGPQTTDTNPDHMLYSTHVWPSNNRHQPRPHAVFHTRVALKQQTPTQTTCCIPPTCGPLPLSQAQECFSNF